MKEERIICFISPSLGKGGTERFLSIITNVLVKDYSVVIITLTNSQVEYVFDERIKIIHINQFWDKNKIKVFIQLYKTLKNIKPTVVIGFSEVFNPISILASKLNRLNVFISERSNPLLKHRLRNRILRTFFYPFANGIIAQTELAKNVFLTKKFNDNICVIPNPLMSFVSSEIDASKKVIITIGSLEKSKNQIELLEIFNKSINRDWKLIIVGDGKERVNLEDRIKQLRLIGKVEMVGKQNNIEYWLRKGSIFMFTSLSEGFPNALNEALAAPLACIAYDCPAGVSDLIENDVNGFLIPLGNQESFIQKLNMLLASETLRENLMMESIKSREKYESKPIAQKILDFINI